MKVKEASLAAVSSMEEFVALTDTAFRNPSEGYLKDRAEFIGNFVDRYVSADSRISDFIALEKRTQSVSQAIRVKTAGLHAVRDAVGFSRLTQSAFKNPPTTTLKQWTPSSKGTDASTESICRTS